MHAAAARDLFRRSHSGIMEKKSLKEREPALINLPLPLPSIPILNPILTPIIGGNNQNAPATTTSTPRTSPTVRPTTDPGTTPPTTPTPPDDPSNPGEGGGGDSGTSTGGGSNGSGTKTEASPTDPAGGSDDSTGPSHSLDQNAGSNPTGLPAHVGLGDDKADGSAARPITIYSNGVPIATKTVVGPPGSTTGFNGDDGSGGNGTDGANNTAASSAPKLSPGVIAAISIIAAIAFLAIFIIARRRRAIAKRSERRTLWWQQAKRDSNRFSGGESLEATAGGTQSCRSSFATTFDHGSHNIVPSTSSTPPVPPMAELRDSHTNGFLLHSQPLSPIQLPSTPALINFDLPAEQNDRRNSTFSTRSAGSDKDAQYLVSNSHSNLANPSPMSVRPFSPSESYSFPKPPPPGQENQPALSDSPDPFSDSAARYSVPVIVSEAWSPLFFGTEVIRRPFAPTLHDEVAVSVGEMVRVSKVFDDGWALVEKSPQSDPTAKGKQKQVQGLIPIDCLREAGEELSKFIAATRVSSYSAIPDANMGSAV